MRKINTLLDKSFYESKAGSLNILLTCIRYQLFQQFENESHDEVETEIFTPFFADSLEGISAFIRYYSPAYVELGCFTVTVMGNLSRVFRSLAQWTLSYRDLEIPEKVLPI
jgi:hypothetical protein